MYAVKPARSRTDTAPIMAMSSHSTRNEPRCRQRSIAGSGHGWLSPVRS